MNKVLKFKEVKMGLMLSIKGKRIMSSNLHYVNFSKMQVIVKQALTKYRCKWDNYFNYAKISSHLGSYISNLSHIYVFLGHFWPYLSH